MVDGRWIGGCLGYASCHDGEKLKAPICKECLGIPRLESVRKYIQRHEARKFVSDAPQANYRYKPFNELVTKLSAISRGRQVYSQKALRKVQPKQSSLIVEAVATIDGVNKVKKVSSKSQRKITRQLF